VLTGISLPGNANFKEVYRGFSSAVSETIAATLGEDIPEPDMAASVSYRRHHP
jgi:hypothetical protein